MLAGRFQKRGNGIRKKKHKKRRKKKEVGNWTRKTREVGDHPIDSGRYGGSKIPGKKKVK